MPLQCANGKAGNFEPGDYTVDESHIIAVVISVPEENRNNVRFFGVSDGGDVTYVPEDRPSEWHEGRLFTALDFVVAERKTAPTLSASQLRQLEDLLIVCALNEL